MSYSTLLLEMGDQLTTSNLIGDYKDQWNKFTAKNIGEVTLIVIPDNKWKYTKPQPTEVEPKKQIVYVKQSYWQLGKDEYAWYIHELAHIQFYQKVGPAEYKQDQKTEAVSGIKTKVDLNNLLEVFTYTTQFKYLKKKGTDRSILIKLLQKVYDREDMEFLNHILNLTYGKT